MSNKARLNATIPQKVSDMLEEYAEEYGISKSGATAMILMQYFEQKEMIQRTKDMPNSVEQLQQLAEKARKTTE